MPNNKEGFDMNNRKVVIENNKEETLQNIIERTEKKFPRLAHERQRFEENPALAMADNEKPPVSKPEKNSLKQMFGSKRKVAKILREAGSKESIDHQKFPDY
ncbi:MAG: hypothetical protein ABSB00_00350 [Minisyncoccia bacterium]|jgi:hypothetical protein